MQDGPSVPGQSWELPNTLSVHLSHLRSRPANHHGPQPCREHLDMDVHEKETWGESGVQESKEHPGTRAIGKASEQAKEDHKLQLAWIRIQVRLCVLGC